MPRRTATEDTRAVAERLAAGLDAATRLVLLDVLSAAAGEITRDLAPGSVDLRLRGREVEFVVHASRAPSGDGDDRPARTVDLDDASTSRTTLRLPDALKARVDEAAAADGLSVNTWLVRAVAAALQPKQRRSDAAHAAHRRQLRRLGALAAAPHLTSTSPARPAGSDQHAHRKGGVSMPTYDTPDPDRPRHQPAGRRASRSSPATAPTPS